MNRIIDTKSSKNKSRNYLEDFDVGNNVEHFHAAAGGARDGAGAPKGGAYPKNEGSSQNQQFKCLKKMSYRVKPGQVESYNGKEGGEKRKANMAPDKDKAESEFSAYNPIWYVFPILNAVIDIIIDLYAVFFWLFRTVFSEVYKSIVPKSLRGTGITIGKKYCFNMGYYRYFVLFLCPPAGVFMAYGLKGWFQILICCAASLFYYFPGLVYAIIVINRSDVAERVKMMMSGECDEDGSGGFNLFITDIENKGGCSRQPNEDCRIDRCAESIPGDDKNKNCCQQPVFVDGVWMRGGQVATDYLGNEIDNYEDGELYCKGPEDTDEIGRKTDSCKKKGMCEWVKKNT